MDFENLALRKRFTPERQQQIDGIISYLFTLGLDGSDLVAIGNKIQREKARLRAEETKAIIASYKLTPLDAETLQPVPETERWKRANGNNFSIRVDDQDYRFQIVNHTAGGYAEIKLFRPNGADSLFSVSYYDTWKLLNSRRYSTVEYVHKAVVLAIHTKKIIL